MAMENLLAKQTKELEELRHNVQDQDLLHAKIATLEEQLRKRVSTMSYPQMSSNTHQEREIQQATGPQETGVISNIESGQSIQKEDLRRAQAQLKLLESELAELKSPMRSLRSKDERLAAKEAEIQQLNEEMRTLQSKLEAATDDKEHG